MGIGDTAKRSGRRQTIPGAKSRKSHAPRHCRVYPHDSPTGGDTRPHAGGWALATGGDGDRATPPSLPKLAIVVAGTVLVVGALTAVPARLGGRRPVTEAMRD